MIERKGASVALKADGDEGSILLTFATLNVIDSDGDVTRPGAFKTDAPVNLAAWGHNWGDLPTGDGRIREIADKAVCDGRFYMSTPQGSQTYATLKERLERGIVNQEWSYGFEVEKESFGEFQGQRVRFLEGLNVIEVSPVMLGAGVATGTLDMKSKDSEQTFTAHYENAGAGLATAAGFVERAKALAAMRGKDGRVLSAANRARLQGLLDQLDSLKTEIGDLLSSTERADPEDDEKGMSLFLAYQKTRAQIVNLIA